MELRVVRWGLLLSGLTVLLGFSLGGLFGGFEDPIQEWLKQQGTSVLATVYQNDPAKMETVLEKSWHYFVRAHMHGGGIGAATLTLSLLLAALPAQALLRRACATLLGLGAIGYSSFWLLAGMRAPLMGSTGLAKESLGWLAIPSAGALLVGVSLTLALIVWTLFVQKQAADS